MYENADSYKAIKRATTTQQIVNQRRQTQQTCSIVINCFPERVHRRAHNGIGTGKLPAQHTPNSPCCTLTIKCCAVHIPLIIALPVLRFL